jgi:HEAT repeat protein
VIPVPPTSPPSSPPESSEQRSDASVITQFFLLPLAVVGGMVGVFLLFTMATRRSSTPEDYLKTLRTGRFNQRWQAAFELSNVIKDATSKTTDPNLQRELAAVFEESMASKDEDPRVRRYLALALGNSGSQEAIAPLMRGAGSPDAETRLYSLAGLARLRANDSRELFLSGLADPDPAIRSVCAFGLGGIQDSDVNRKLNAALKDTAPEVRWNAALALARHGDDSGQAILVEMLDRKYLDGFPHLQAEDKAELILNAMRGLKNLKVNGLDQKLRELSETDPSPTVRRAAKSWDEPDPS